MARPPKWLWVLAAGVAGLRLLPFVATFVLSAPEGQAFLKVGYMPEDMHAYLSFIRQVPERGAFFFENSYLTEAQSGRFILLFHWVLGVVSSITGLAPHWVLELSRIPLVFGFFWVVWWFLEPVCASREHQSRATLFVGLSGGVEGFIRPFADRLPEAIGRPLAADTWPLNGWNTFESLYNPLWIAGLILMLVVLRRLLRPDDDRRRGLDLIVSLGVFVLFFVHPYSAVMVFAIAAVHLTCDLTLDRRIARWRLERFALGLGPAAVGIGAVAIWQSKDPVFEASSAAFFGPLQLSVFWYPLTLGLLLWLAVRGATRWISAEHPYRRSIFSWVGAAVLLHTSNVINGYHFVPYLHLPVAILAAHGTTEVWTGLRHGALGRRAGAAALTALLFASPVWVTLEGISELRERNNVPTAFLEILPELGALPRGNVLGPPRLGLLIPAYTHHRVWAGHWFMTPDYWLKVDRYEQLVRDPAASAELVTELAGEDIDYLVVPTREADRIALELGPALESRVSVAGAEILTLDF